MAGEAFPIDSSGTWYVIYQLMPSFWIFIIKNCIQKNDYWINVYRGGNAWVLTFCKNLKSHQKFELNILGYLSYLLIRL